MEADLERILVDSIQLETENMTLKQLINNPVYYSKPDLRDQLKNMLHYNQQVRTFYGIIYTPIPFMI